jgi:cytochrome c biogenesis protein CcmG, thiol:disulfide interchange protein DsbE
VSKAEMTDRRRALLAAIPLVGFAGLAALFWRGLSGDPSRLPSRLIGQQAPDFKLPSIAGLPLPGLQTADLKQGSITLVNIFASWCAPCRDEHPILMELSKRPDIHLVGINNKDKPDNAIRFLNALGNPYQKIGADDDGRVTIDWGGYGVPETFVVDGNGTIRHKIIGPLSPERVTSQLIPEIEKAKTS